MSSLARGLRYGLLPACLLVAIPAIAVADDWIEVQSPNFRVVSNQGTRAARRVALELERIRAVMVAALPGAVEDPLRPVVVFAVEGADDLVALAPMFQDGPRPGGAFLSGQYMHHIVLRIEAGHETIYHEYFHLLTRLSAPWLPMWLVEGLAEFYSHVDLSSSTAKIGQPDPVALTYLRRRSLVPLREFLARTTNPHLDDPNQLRVFYAQSWALTHLMILGHEDAAVGQQGLARYMALAAQGTDPVAAFEQAVGNIEELDRQLREYVRHVSFREFRMKVAEDIDDGNFMVRELSRAEALALRANVLTKGVDPDAALPLLEEAEALEEHSAVLAEAMGLFHLRQGSREEADRWFAEAIRLGASSYIPYYRLALAAEDNAVRIERLRQAQPVTDCGHIQKWTPKSRRHPAHRTHGQHSASAPSSRCSLPESPESPPACRSNRPVCPTPGWLVRGFGAAFLDTFRARACRGVRDEPLRPPIAQGGARSEASRRG